MGSAGPISNLSVSKATDYEVFGRKLGCETFRMYLNLELDENRQLKTPAARVTGDRTYGMSVISFRCTLEEELEDYDILALKTNLLESSDFNPNQILNYITGRKKTKFITFVPPYPITYKLGTSNLSDGFFELMKINSGEILVMTSAAITVKLRSVNRL